MTSPLSNPKKIAVIGGGIAGVTAAYILSKQHDVSLFEAQDKLGGHTNTITVPNGPDQGLAIDTGFIVCNQPNYPTFQRLLKELGVATQVSDMSFSFHDASSGFMYCSDFPKGVFADSRNIFSLPFYKMIMDIGNFNRRAVRDFDEGRLRGLSLAEYLDSLPYGEYFRNYYLIPMSAAIWSASFDDISAFPAEAFIRFWKNHCLLTLGARPDWLTIQGGSHSYIRAFTDQFKGRIVTSRPVNRLRRFDDHIEVLFSAGPSETFDEIVLAVHADQAFRMLGDPTEDERRLLGVWKYSKNPTVLHTDASIMPPNRNAWASWTYTQDSFRKDAPVTVSYYMNRLQRLDSRNDYFVTLNPNQEINEDAIIYSTTYTHPIFNQESMDTQSELNALNGQRRTAYCGSYFGYGFHEDGALSGLRAAEALGVTW